MKASELRIGNLVNTEDGNFSVFEILENDIVMENNISFAKYYVKPIPLTEEWLLKFGFKRDYYTMELNDFKLEAGSRIIDTDTLSGFGWEQIKDEKYLSISYLHQLQNLYFAICGIELKINDK